jgi:hypothetical protein
MIIICIPFIRREIEMTRDNRITPIEIGCAITKSATTIEELVNQLETFVAYDCPRIILVYTSNYESCFCSA